MSNKAQITYRFEQQPIYRSKKSDEYDKNEFIKRVDKYSQAADYDEDQGRHQSIKVADERDIRGADGERVDGGHAVRGLDGERVDVERVIRGVDVEHGIRGADGELVDVERGIRGLDGELDEVVGVAGKSEGLKGHVVGEGKLRSGGRMNREEASRYSEHGLRDAPEEAVLGDRNLVSDGKRTRDGYVKQEDLKWHSFPSQLSTWQSPYDIETDELEKIIRETNEVSLSQKREMKDDHYFSEFAVKEGEQQWEKDAVNDEFSKHDDVQQSHVQSQTTEQTYASEQPYTSEQRHESSPYTSGLHTEPLLTSYTQRSPNHWGKLIFAILGAIITGGVFGMFVLSLFPTSDGNTPLNMNEFNEQQSVSGHTANEIVELGVGTDLGDVVQEEIMLPSVLPEFNYNASIAVVNIPSKSFYLLQNGMFSSADGAESAMLQLTANGFAAASELWDYHYVYAGMSANRDDALLISHMLHEEDYETYIKTFHLPAVRAVQWEIESADQLQDYIIQGNQIAEMVSSLTIIHLQQAAATDIDQTYMTSISKAHQAWNSLSAAVHEGIPADYESTLQKMDTALNTSMISLEAYNKNPSFSYLWQAQTTLINYIILQKQLLLAIGVN